MKKLALSFEGAPKKAGPYSHAVILNNVVYVSGQGPINPETNEISGRTTKDQTEQTLKNIKFILEQAGSDLEHVVKVNAYLQNLVDFQEFNEVYSRFFPQDQPVRTTVGTNLLNILVEIDCIAGLRE